MKKILGRDVNVIEPTLGFNIETIPVELEGDDQPYQVRVNLFEELNIKAPANKSSLITKCTSLF